MGLRERALAAKDPGVLRTRGKSRAEWLEQGRLLGENEADRRGELGAVREERVARAVRYAGWEWDGKPSSSGTGVKVFGSDPKQKEKRQ